MSLDIIIQKTSPELKLKNASKKSCGPIIGRTNFIEIGKGYRNR